jgi:hypothetical protein
MVRQRAQNFVDARHASELAERRKFAVAWGVNVAELFQSATLSGR